MADSSSAARRNIPIRLVGVGVDLVNSGSAVTVAIPANANAFYVGSNCTITFDGTAATATRGFIINSSSNCHVCKIPQGSPSLSVYGNGSASYIQFVQVSC